MKITIYELLGLAKDNKAPKKIRYDGEEYKTTKILLENNNIYFNYINEDMECLFPINTNYLNDEVEILEEEKKIPNEIKSLNNVGNVQDLVEFADKQQLNNHILKDKLNEIIQYLKSKGE